MNIRDLRTRLLFLGLVGVLAVPGAFSQEKKPNAQPQPASKEAPAKPTVACAARDRFFEEEVWAKVGERTCLKCHNADGDAAESTFILSLAAEGVAKNCQTFEQMAKANEGEQSRMLLKVSGQLEHGGGQVLKPDSTGYRILERYVKRVRGEKLEPLAPTDDYNAPPFFQDVVTISPTRLLRRVTLSLVGRLPSPEETAVVETEGIKAFNTLVDKMMQEDAFFVRLKEGFNDIFLTMGIEDNPDQALLSYEHFEKTRHWYAQHDFSALPESERERAGWKLADVYRQSLLREPLELVAHIVKNNRPFSELATADYIMVSPHSAKGYGIFDEFKDKFKDTEDPHEYIPAKLKALKSRDGKEQESATGLYPHAGFLSMFHYLHRYPSTETNRNRLRARMFYQHFLGIDIMELAPRVTDAAAVSAKYEVPTMQAADCVVCHKTIDPVAGIFQDFNFEGHIGPRKEGWYKDMFQAGYEGEEMPASERWRAPQWLGERAVKDPRFPIAMVEHVYYILFGRKPMLPPADIDDPVFGGKRRAYRAQRKLIEDVAAKFKADNFNLKTAFKHLIASEFYRVDGLATVAKHPQRAAELDDLGIVRLVTPEQLERKVGAIFGKQWNRLDGDLKVLYGGIDSITVTERNADPSGAMGAIQRLLANDLACYHTARDFRRPPAERLLFPKIEPTDVPGDEGANQKIRSAVIDLQRKILGTEPAADDPEVERTFQLFVNVVADAKAGKFEPRETYFCGGREEFKTDDPHYTIRAWRAVLTYLLRQHEFLYE